jgi:ABC-type transport system involved in Fe-S cluster assembly fused permease/ATPase subunit
LHEEKRYDKALREYSMANIRSQQTLAVLNSGQQLIIVAGVVGAMILAADLVVKDKLTIGQQRTRTNKHQTRALESPQSSLTSLFFVAHCCSHIQVIGLCSTNSS